MIGRRNFSVTTLAISVAEFVHMTAATSNISRKYARDSRAGIYTGCPPASSHESRITARAARFDGGADRANERRELVSKYRAGKMLRCVSRFEIENDMHFSKVKFPDSNGC